MSIQVSCQSCGHVLKAPNNSAGKSGKCPQCGAKVKVPGVATPQDFGSLPVVEAQAVENASYWEPPEGTIPVAPAPQAATDGDGEDSGSAARRPCPACGTMIPMAALKCRVCNEIFDPKLKKATAKAAAKAVKGSFSGGEGDDLTAGEWVLAILCSTIGCIVGIVWMIQGKPKGKKMLLISVCVQLVWGAVRFAIEMGNRS